MNRTKAILVFAALLALSAVIIARGGKTATIPVPKPAPTPGPVAVQKGPIKLGSSLSGTHLLQGGNGEVYLDISLNVGKARGQDRAPVSIALVIDRSGSMAGEKLQHARAAARRLVASLSDGDRLALISYGSDVTTEVASTLISSHSRRLLLHAIDDIADRGGTYLSGGFEAGRDELLRAASASPEHLSRIILISDGQANEGITSTSKLADMSRKALSRGVHLTTMGVGLDFNENLMTAMAEHGGGHYYFIKNSDALAGIFEKELKTLKQAVARRARLTVQLEPGVQLVQLFGYSHRQSGRQVHVDLPDMYGGQQRMVMLKLRAPTDSAGERQLAQVQVSYSDVVTGDSLSLTTTTSATVTADARLVKSSRDRTVLARAEQAKISANLTRAMESYASGDVAGASSSLRNQIAVTTEANEELRSATLDRILGKLKRQLKTAREAAPSSAEGRALTKGGKYEAYQMAK